MLPASHYRFSSSKTWKGIVLCGLIALVLVRSEGRLESGIKDLRGRTSVASDPIVAKMKQYADHTHWVYAEQEIYPFDAGLSTPPELTVVVLKRFWSRQITTTQIVDTCRRYQTEQILLNPAKTGNEWKGLLADYDAVYQGTNYVLYVAKQIEH